MKKLKDAERAMLFTPAGEMLTFTIIKGDRLKKLARHGTLEAATPVATFGDGGGELALRLSRNVPSVTQSAPDMHNRAVHTFHFR